MRNESFVVLDTLVYTCGLADWRNRGGLALRLRVDGSTIRHGVGMSRRQVQKRREMELKVVDKTGKTNKVEFSALKVGEVFSGEMNVCYSGERDPIFRYRGKMMKTNGDRVLVLSGAWLYLADEPQIMHMTTYTVLQDTIVTNYVSLIATLIIE